MCDVGPMLDAKAVQARYDINDPRVARSIIESAGGRLIGGRWQIRLDRIIAWEDKADLPCEVDRSTSPINDHANRPARRTAIPERLEGSDWRQRLTDAG